MTKSFFWHAVFNHPHKEHQQFAFGIHALDTSKHLIDQVLALVPTDATNVQITAFNEVRHD